MLIVELQVLLLDQSSWLGWGVVGGRQAVHAVDPGEVELLLVVAVLLCVLESSLLISIHLVLVQQSLRHEPRSILPYVVGETGGDGEVLPMSAFDGLLLSIWLQVVDHLQSVDVAPLHLLVHHLHLLLSASDG